jgi:MFS family permease
VPRLALSVVGDFSGFSPTAKRFLLLTLVTFVSNSLFGLVFNLYLSSLGVSNEVIGMLNALPGVFMLAVGMPACALAERLGFRPLFAGGVAGALVGSCLLALAGSLPGALVAGALYTLATAITAQLGIPLLAAVSGERQRLGLYSLNHAISWTATLLGSLAGGFLPEIAARSLHLPANSPGPLRVAFLVMVLANALALPAVLALRDPELRGRRRQPLRLSLEWGGLARLLVPASLMGTAAGMVVPFLPLYLFQRFGTTPGPTAVVLGVAAALTAVVILMAPRMVARTGRRRLIVVSQLLAVPCIVLMAVTPLFSVAVAALLVRQLLLNLQAPVNQAYIIDIVPQAQRATYFGSQNLVWCVGFGGLGPLLSGLLQARGGFVLAFGFASIVYLAAPLSFWALLGDRRRAFPAAPPVIAPAQAA